MSEFRVEYRQNGKLFETPILRHASHITEPPAYPARTRLLKPTNLKRSDARLPSLPKNNVYEIIGVRTTKNKIGPGNVIRQIDQAGARQRELVCKRETTAHAVKSFQQVANQP